MKIVEPSVELLSITPNAARLIERVGRVAYKSEDKAEEGSAEAFIRMLIKRGHESVLEHASATLLFVCDRGVTHEMVRHRIASYTQESTRFCNYGGYRFGREITVIEPPGLLAGVGGTREQWTEACRAAERAYLALIDAGQSPQIARSVLPTCLKTEIATTYNIREWRHFFRLRCAKAAHPQMREVANMALYVLHKEEPCLFDDMYGAVGEDRMT